MKKKLFLLFLLPLMLQNCSQDENMKPSKSTLSFTLSFSDPGGRQNALEDATTVLLSLQTASGDEVFTHHPVNLLAFGNGYITESIELEPGNYKVTDFLLTDGTSEVLYAVPQKGSALESTVTHALPYSFSVQNGKVASVDMDVVSVDTYTPEDFGYASFIVAEARPLPISVFIIEDGKTKLASATAYVVRDEEVVRTYPLKASPNLVGFKDDPAATYTLTILKDGYAPYYKQFVYNDLIASLGTSALQVFLEPALTLVISLRNAHVEDTEFTLSVTIDKPNANVHINWGDSTSQDIIWTNLSDIRHSYPTENRTYNMTITGDIDFIKEIDTNAATPILETMTTKNLFNLTSANFYFGGPKITDLRFNKNLVATNISGDKVMLPDNHHITYLGMDGERGLIPYMDYVIDNLYINTKRNNTFNGSFSYQRKKDSSEEEPLAPLSPESKAKLQELQGFYNWTVFPEPN